MGEGREPLAFQPQPSLALPGGDTAQEQKEGGRSFGLSLPASSDWVREGGPASREGEQGTSLATKWFPEEEDERTLAEPHSGKTLPNRRANRGIASTWLGAEG